MNARCRDAERAVLRLESELKAVLSALASASTELLKARARAAGSEPAQRQQALIPHLQSLREPVSRRQLTDPRSILEAIMSESAMDLLSRPWE